MSFALPTLFAQGDHRAWESREGAGGQAFEEPPPLQREVYIANTFMIVNEGATGHA